MPPISQTSKNHKPIPISIAIIIRVILWIILLISSPFLLFGLLAAGFSISRLSYTSSTKATITKVESEEPQWSDGSSSTICTLIYSYNVQGINYTKNNGMSTAEYCYMKTNDTIVVKYDPKNPSKSYPDSDDSGGLLASIIFALFGLTPMILPIAGLITLSRYQRTADTDSDGLGDDSMPATSAQITLLKNRFRDIGVYWEPKEKMTQAQVREVQREIDNQLRDGSFR